MPKKSGNLAISSLERKLKEAIDEVVTLTGANPPPHIVKRIRERLSAHADEVEVARARIDPIRIPKSIFDPSDPATVGKMVSIALIAQPMVALSDIQPLYGSGVYAIYYCGDHPFYKAIAGTETPIYVGKADPKSNGARTVREQGPTLTSRLKEHAKTIRVVEAYAGKLPENLSPIHLSEFFCRRLVCATNAQLAAEKHLIQMFRPLWNSDTRACWGFSKHGDAAETRGNKRSPWHVVHPGKPSDLNAILKDSYSPEKIKIMIDNVLRDIPPRHDHASLLEEMLRGFRQNESELNNAQVTPVEVHDLELDLS